MIVWHYTVGMWAVEILDSGILLPASKGVYPPEKPILWFSSNQHFEMTACKGSGPFGRWWSPQETSERCGGLFRFGVPIERTIKWPEVGRRAGTRAKMRGHLIKTGRGKGADPSEWYGIIGSIPVEETRAQVLLDFRIWVSIPTLAEIQQNLEGLEIRIQTTENIEQLALDAYRQRGGKIEDQNDDHHFLERICVNYVRHQLTNYEENLERTGYGPGREIALRSIRRKIYAAIARAYPQLAEECKRQRERRGI